MERWKVQSDPGAEQSSLTVKVCVIRKETSSNWVTILCFCCVRLVARYRNSFKWILDYRESSKLQTKDKQNKATEHKSMHQYVLIRPPHQTMASGNTDVVFHDCMICQEVQSPPFVGHLQKEYNKGLFMIGGEAQRK